MTLAHARIVIVLLCGMRFSSVWAQVPPGDLLVAPGSVWKYWDKGSQPSVGWNAVSFDDSNWSQGAAQFGYGDSPADEATVVSFGPDPDNKYVTTYFRKAFNVASPSAYNRLSLRALRDDGLIVYLNGTEIYRNNMPSGAVSYGTLATTNVYGGAESVYYSFNLAATALLAGANVLAAEVHQAGGDSIDLSFDLSLAASDTAQVTRGPYLQQGTPTSVIVKWRTDRPTDSLVRLGTSEAALNLVFADLTPTTEHQVLVTGLSPDTYYFYSIGSSATEQAGGSDYYFLTSPPGAKPTRIWVLGDAGTQTFQQQQVRDAYYNYSQNRHTDLWLMLGDNAYGTGTDQQYQAAVFNMYPEMLRKSVLWSTIGNHETYSAIDYDHFAYLDIFTLPRAGEAGGVPSGTEKYYSFDYGNIHFVCLDSMTVSRQPGSPMLSWLEEDLAANTNQWLVAFWHHPPYTKGSHDSDYEGELVEMRANVLPLLESYGVDLVLSGHSHCYERTYLLNGHYGSSWELQPSMRLDSGSGRPEESGAYLKQSLGPAGNQGAVYIVAGSSGQISGGSLDHPAMFLSLNQLGSLVLDVNGPTLEAKFLREDGTIGDHFTMRKGATADFAITQFQIADNLFYIQWKSRPNHFYRLQTASILSPANWMDISGDIQATGNTTSYFDFFSPSDTLRIFRIVETGD